jgi:hypothetical protein
MDDEAWVAALRSRSADLAPTVPVDVPLALRRGRRRRAARGVAVGGGALVAACGVVVVAVAAIPSLLGGLGSMGSADSASDAGALRPTAAADEGAAAGGSASLTAPELAAAVADGSLGADPVVVIQSGVPSSTPFLAAIRPGTEESSIPNASGTYPAEKWAGFMRPCLAQAGWEVDATGDGWTVEVAPSRAQDYLDALADCVQQYPVD